MGRIFLHIGAPKTGTTFLQEVLWEGRATWPAQGVTYPLEYPKEHFEAAVDVLDLEWGGRHRPEWAGRWAALVERARRQPGDVVISNELLAAAPVEVVRRIASDFEGFERHLLITLRSYSSMLISDWQEQIKHRHTADWPEYLHDVLEDPSSHFGQWVPEHHDVVDVLDRWSAFAAGERVHVIVNKAGAGPEWLWHAFAGVVGTTGEARGSGGRVNTSIGLDASRALARINAHVAGFDGNEYRRLVSVRLVEEVLPIACERTVVALPDRVVERVRATEELAVARLSAGGYDIVGDPATLVEATSGTVGGVSEQQVALADSLAALVMDIADRDRRLAEWDRIEQIRSGRWWRRAIVRARSIIRASDATARRSERG